MLVDMSEWKQELKEQKCLPEANKELLAVVVVVVVVVVVYLPLFSFVCGGGGGIL